MPHLNSAKELGLVPRSLIKNIPSPKQQWKAPVKDWIRDLYSRRHPSAQATQRANSDSARPSDEQYDAHESHVLDWPSDLNFDPSAYDDEVPF